MICCFHCSSPVAVSWQWWSMTLWPVTVAAMGSSPYDEARLWRFWSGSMINLTGAWSGPQTALPLRRESFLVPFSALLTPDPPWKWKGYSTTKVGSEHLLNFFRHKWIKKGLFAPRCISHNSYYILACFLKFLLFSPLIVTLNTCTSRPAVMDTENFTGSFSFYWQTYHSWPKESLFLLKKLLLFPSVAMQLWGTHLKNSSSNYL